MHTSQKQCSTLLCQSHEQTHLLCTEPLHFFSQSIKNSLVWTMTFHLIDLLLLQCEQVLITKMQDILSSQHKVITETNTIHTILVHIQQKANKKHSQTKNKTHQHYGCYKILMVNNNILNLNTDICKQSDGQSADQMQITSNNLPQFGCSKGVRHGGQTNGNYIYHKSKQITQNITLCSILLLLFYFLLTCVYPNNSCQKQHKDKSNILQEKEVETLSLNTESLTPIWG